jgi:hypothetical protein
VGERSVVELHTGGVHTLGERDDLEMYTQWESVAQWSYTQEECTFWKSETIWRSTHSGRA